MSHGSDGAGQNFQSALLDGLVRISSRHGELLIMYILAGHLLGLEKTLLTEEKDLADIWQSVTPGVRPSYNVIRRSFIDLVLTHIYDGVDRRGTVDKQGKNPWGRALRGKIRC